VGNRASVRADLAWDVRSAIYDSDPNQAPDIEFARGELSYLVVGNAGRLLDARRTPIMTTAVDAELDMFEVEIEAFEDVGARWRLPVEDVGRFQFAAGASDAVLGDVHGGCRFSRYSGSVPRFRHKDDDPDVNHVDPEAGVSQQVAIALEHFTGLSLAERSAEVLEIVAPAIDQASEEGVLPTMRHLMTHHWLPSGFVPREQRDQHAARSESLDLVLQEAMQALVLARLLVRRESIETGTAYYSTSPDGRAALDRGDAAEVVARRLPD
jgi:hypothetical protein